MVDTLIDTEHLDTKISPEKDTDPSETSEKVGLNHKLNSTGIVYRDYISDSSEINSDSSSLFNDPSLRQSTGDLTLISKAVSIDTHSNSATPGSSIIVPAERNPVSDLLRSPSSTKKHKHRHSIPDMSTLEYYSHRTSLDDLTTTCEEKLVIQPSQEIIPEEKEPRHLPAPEINPKARFITMEEALSIEDSVDTPLEKQMNEIKSLEQRRSIKRLNAIKELMETEETYSRDLGILCTHFFAIIQQATCITPEEIDILVRNAMDIYVFQEKFTEALMDAHGEQEAEKNGIFYKGNLKQIATCFVEWAPKFDIYLDYCVRQDHAASVYNELLQTNLEFSNLIERLHTFHRVSFGFSRLKFDDYMITPFQRIFRYRLLLQSITKATQKDTEEYEILSKAQNIVHAIATKINNEKSKMEAKRKTALFLSRLDSDWCLPKRWFSTLGVCTLIGTLEVRSMIDNKPKRIGCALFDHYMIMAKAKKHKQYEPRYWFPLRKFDIEDIPHLEGEIH
ncbi:hypothetical protein CU098_009970 [Rhizopus stolonifer]|uniref:DH domain-containing protein n=1 Tax=Rhizopus stolonifer TaxID=4846 RepID=A0A367JX30_RHIST|nr:hypothetical protein CU098_009970 [Rhizopus stolonifer]